MQRAELEDIFGAESDVLRPIEDHLVALAVEPSLPDLSVAACIVRLEEAAPALRAVLARAAEGETLTDEEARLLFRGVHILGGGRDTLSFAPLLRFLRRPAEEVEDLLGDCITEALPRIAAGAFDGDVDSLFEAIRDRSADEFVRKSLLGAATFLAWEHRIARSRMEAFLVGFYEERAADDWEHVWAGWLEAIALLGLRSLVPMAEAAWRAGVVEPDYMEWSHFEEDFDRAEREPDDIGRFTSAHLGYVEDVLAALAPYTEEGWGDDVAGLDPFNFEPATNPWRHVGRNDPCPCGSGRKFKKCCLAG